jgi:hypothetical protein
MNPMIKLCTGVALLLGAGAGSFFLVFGAALNQEKDTVSVLRAIGQSHLTGNTVVAIQPGQNRWIVRDMAGLNQVLQQQGWNYRDRAGAMIFYQKNQARLDVSCGMFSRFYLICEAGTPWS